MLHNTKPNAAQLLLATVKGTCEALPFGTTPPQKTRELNTENDE